MMQAEPGIPQSCSIFPGRAPQPPRPSRRWGAGAALVVLVAVLGIATPEDARAQVTATATVPDPDPDPSEPLHLRVSANSERVILNWNVPASDGWTDITKYEYRYAVWAGDPLAVGDFTMWSLLQLESGPPADGTLNARVRGVEVEGLTTAPGTKYTFEVRAVNSANEDGTPATKTVTTERLPIELSWDAREARLGPSFTLTITFSEAVNGFELNDINIITNTRSDGDGIQSGGKKENFLEILAKTKYSVEVTPVPYQEGAQAEAVSVFIFRNRVHTVDGGTPNEQKVQLIDLTIDSTIDPNQSPVTSNTAPTAANKTVTTRVGTAYTFDDDDFGFADTDAGDTLASVKIVTVPTPGTLALDGTAVTLNQVVTKRDIDADILTFTPVAGASGDPYATFTFKVNDGTDDSASTYTMTIDVTAAPVTNTAPTAANNTVTTAQDTKYIFDADDFGFADTDAGDTLASVKIVSLPAAGTLLFDDNVTTAIVVDQVVTKRDIDADILTFTPVAGASGTGYASFTFKVNDGRDDSADTYTMTINVTATAPGAPGAPTGLTATANGPSRINLAWTAPASTGGSPITGYRIEVSPDGSSSWSDRVANTGSTATTYAHMGLNAATTRHYRVSAINAGGSTSVASNIAATTTTTASTPRPPAVAQGRRSSPPPPPPPGDVVGLLENPGATSFQSGIGVISGWVCDAEAVEITLNGEPQEAAYGTARLDTEAVCGDSDNGFGLLFNWNLLEDGEHEVVALVDGVELDRATVMVTTLGTEFLRDVTGTCTAADFPTMDETVTLAWQQTQQNFVIAEGAAPAGPTNRTGTPGMGYLENPGPNSFQSGIGVLSGWACEGEEVVIELNGAPQPAGYGTERLDTEETCGDTDNGFGLLFNWNLLGEGEHEVVAYVDGEELGRATVQVTTLGAEFVLGAEGECVVEDFPMLGETVTLEWQQNSQNFVITEVEGGSTL